MNYFLSKRENEMNRAYSGISDIPIHIPKYFRLTTSKAVMYIIHVPDSNDLMNNEK